MPAALLKFARLPSAVKKSASVPACFAAWRRKPWNCQARPPPLLVIVAPYLLSPCVRRLAHSCHSTHVVGGLFGSIPPSRTNNSCQIRW